MRFLVLGAGKMGYAIALDLLANQAVKQVMIVDPEQSSLEQVHSLLDDKRVATVQSDISDCDELGYLMTGCDVVISCGTVKYNYELAKVAMEAGAHFCDLGGNEDIVRKQFLLDEMAKEKNVAIIPNCGLTPGLISILAAAACARLDDFSEIRLRVGTLPVEPRPPLNYSLFFSVDGLIDEYVEDATAIRNGRLVRVPALQDLEAIEFPDPFQELEAFNTGGGISTLATTFGARVNHLDFKSIRYKGHCQMVSMLRDLGLMETRPCKLGSQQVRPRAILAMLLEQKLPKNEPDVVLLLVSVHGTKSGTATEVIWQAVDFMDEVSALPAIMRMTAFPISIIAQMVASGQISARGTLIQERDIPSAQFLEELQSRGVPLKLIEKQTSK